MKELIKCRIDLARDFLLGVALLGEEIAVVPGGEGPGAVGYDSGLRLAPGQQQQSQGKRQTERERGARPMSADIHKQSIF